MRIPIRTSRLAIWSRRLGSFALPLMLVPILMHRERMMETPTFHAVEIVAAGLALVAVLLGLVGLVRLWFTGDRGWSRALGGIAVGGLALLPVLWLGWNAWHYPYLRDVSTDLARPLQMTSPVPATVWTPELRRAVAISFPGAVARVYALPVEQVFTLVERLVADRGWEVRQRRAPVGVGAEGQLNVVVPTLFGWREEAAIRVSGLADGARVDMRSASPMEPTCRSISAPTAPVSRRHSPPSTRWPIPRHPGATILPRPTTMPGRRMTMPSPDAPASDPVDEPAPGDDWSRRWRGRGLRLPWGCPRMFHGRQPGGSRGPTHDGLGGAVDPCFSPNRRGDPVRDGRQPLGPAGRRFTPGAPASRAGRGRWRLRRAPRDSRDAR